MPHLHFRLRRVATAATVFLGVAGADAYASANLSVGDGSTPVGRNAAINFIVERSGDTGFPVTVQYATVDGTAKAGSDYTATSGTLSFAAGETSKQVSVAVTKKVLLKARTFTLNLSNAQAMQSLPFSYGGSTPVGRFTTGAAVADYNGDGKLDFAITGLTTTLADSGILRVLRNDSVAGAANVNFGEAYTKSGVTDVKVTAADLNRDGKPDIYAAGGGVYDDVVFVNTTPTGATTFSFAPTTVPDTAPGVISNVTAAYGDFDGDGIVDVATLQSGIGAVRVLRNTTPVGAAVPKLNLATTVKLGDSPLTVVVADLNGDGKPDLASGDSASNSVSVAFNTTAAGGAITFAPAVRFATRQGPTDIAAADFDGDGRIDLVTANNQPVQSGTTFSVLMNTTPKGGGTPSFVVSDFLGDAPFGVTTADIDGDGKPDVVIAALGIDQDGNGGIDVYLNKTPLGATSPSLVLGAQRPAGDQPQWVVVRDYNGDGRNDLLSADFEGSTADLNLGGKPSGTLAEAKIVDGSGTGTITPRDR